MADDNGAQVRSTFEVRAASLRAKRGKIMGNLGAVMRLVALTLIALAIWFLGKYDTGIPAPKDQTAPPTEFSAARAGATLGRLLGPEVPHPISSVENANVRSRVQAEFAALGVKTRVYSGLGCMSRPKRGFFVCGTTKDVIADVIPGEGKAVVMLAHYDSVPAGPGAGDDESGVATILETVRALKARAIQSKHPVIALITDGEEAGLLGAASFLHDPANRARVGVVVNVEARGNQGPSLLFQTSPGDSKLIDLYAKNVPEVATSSLFAVIYKLLPNDTDLSVFLEYGLTGVNFAFSGNVAHYHTPLDRRENLSLATLQHHGDNMLGMTAALMQTDFESLKGGDDIYISLFGKWLPRLPSSWALPLALLSFVLILLAGFLSRSQLNSIGQWAAALAMPPAVLIGCGLAGWLLHTLAQLVSGQPDPSYAHPATLRFAIGFGVLAIVVLCTRMAQPRLAALSVWLWMSALGVATAALITGLSPYFLFPSLIAAILLVAQTRIAGAWTGLVGDVALFLAAIPALIIWLALAAGGEDVMGLAMHALVTVPAAFGLMTLVPLIAARRMSRLDWLVAAGSTGVLALILAVVAGTRPAFSAVAPQRLSVMLVDDHIANKALWIAQTQAPLPRAVRAAASFSAKPEIPYAIAFQPVYVAPSGNPRFTPPTVTIDNKPDGNRRRVVLSLNGSEAAEQILIAVPKEAKLDWVEIGGQRMKTQLADRNIIGCASADCRSQVVTLELASRGPVDLLIAEQRYGLPVDGEKIAAARPKEAIASQSGDVTLILKKITIH
jgi:hypothetical protein